MKFSILGMMSIASLVLLLGACNNGNNVSETSTPTSSASSSAPPVAAASPTTAIKTTSKGGQVVESGKYYLEFLPEKEANATHLDLYVQQGDTHQSIPNAKVNADVQLPDGQQKSLSLSYDASGKHYAVELPGTTPGQYQVKVTVLIGKDQVNGRFSFDR